MREALLGIRARMRTLPVTDKCEACGPVGHADVQVLSRMRRAAYPRLEDVEVPSITPTVDVLPLPFTGRIAERQALLEHMRRPRAATAACCWSATKAAVARRCCAGIYKELLADGGVIYQIGSDPSGSPRRSTRCAR